MKHFNTLISKLQNLHRRKAAAILVSGVALSAGAVYFLGPGGSSSPSSTAQKTDSHAGHEHSDGASEGETKYTCSMHPQVIQDEPGTCPICGMDLTPLKVGGGKSASAQTKDAGQKEKGKIKYWVAPMDPSFRSDKPGKSPMGMDLVPVYEDEGQSLAAGDAVIIDPVVVQNMGVRVEKARRGKVIRNIRTIGEVEVAENEVSVVNLRFSGWIEKIWADETEKKVNKGTPLFQIYSPELIAAQEEYLLAVKGSGGNPELAESAKKRLELWEIPRSHIKKLLETGNGQLRLIVRAPRSGYILQKNVVLGNRIEKGLDLYRIGNLSKIWIRTDVYEHDVPWVSLGQKAKMTLSFQSGQAYEGQVSYVYPTLNEKTRTLTVRLEFSNPGLNLKPGMFATVYIEARTRSNALVIPTESIIHSGERKIVFVSPELGKYEPRKVVTGLIGDNRVTEILSGVREGETVVSSGQFLLDSESQLQEALNKLMAKRLQVKQQKKTAEGGKELQLTSAGEPESDKRESYYTCSMHPHVVQDEPGTCPICGMDLVEKKRQ